MSNGKAILAILAGAAAGVAFGAIMVSNNRSRAGKKISRKGEDLADALNDKIDRKFEELLTAITGKVKKHAQQNEPGTRTESSR